MKSTLRNGEPLPTFSCVYIAIDLDSFRLNERKFDNDPPTFVRHVKPDCLRPIFVLGPDSDPALVLENLKKLATHEPRRFDDETEMRLAFLTVPGSRYPKKEVVAINSAIWAGEFPCVALTHQMAVSACTVPMGKDRHPLPILNRSQGNNLYLNLYISPWWLEVSFPFRMEPMYYPLWNKLDSLYDATLEYTHRQHCHGSLPETFLSDDYESSTD